MRLLSGPEALCRDPRGTVALGSANAPSLKSCFHSTSFPIPYPLKNLLLDLETFFLDEGAEVFELGLLEHRKDY